MITDFQKSERQLFTFSVIPGMPRKTALLGEHDLLTMLSTVLENLQKKLIRREAWEWQLTQ